MALAFNGSDVFTSVVKNLCLKYTEHKDVDLSGVRSLASSAKGGRILCEGHFREGFSISFTKDRFLVYFYFFLKKKNEDDKM